MEHDNKVIESVYHLARLSLAGSRPEILMQIRRLGRRLRADHPEAADRLEALLADQPTRSTPVRSATVESVPVDSDSRLQLARVAYPVEFDVEPIWDEAVSRPLGQVVSERSKEEALREAGLAPTRSLLFVGPPGVGKTLAASWLARALNRPLITLDLAAVMNQFLGRTGGNIRQVLDYAKGVDCVLLLDELDAVAKRRDDAAEIGELKRLVTVLIQEIDGWPASGILVAATNHPDLLDPAIWRRFDMIIEFPLPGMEQARRHVSHLIGPDVDTKIIDLVSTVYQGRSYGEIERDLLRARREALIMGQPVEQRIESAMAGLIKNLPKNTRFKLADAFIESGWPQRRVTRLTGVSRTTIRNKRTRGDSDDTEAEGQGDAE